MKPTLYFLVLFALLALPAHAQIGMGGQPHSSAVLDLKASDKALYLPRMTTVQRKAMPSPQVGAFVFDLDQNALYIFDGQTWLPLATQDPTQVMPVSRFASDGAYADQFGDCVAIFGDYALVGARNHDVGGNNDQGAVYVFARTGNSWTELTKLTASDGAANDNFGNSVSLAGDYALIGASGDDVGADVNQGSAYVFLRSGVTWTQQAKLLATDGAAGDGFGNSVSISGSYALIGAPSDDGSNVNQGSAYIFIRAGAAWTQQDKIVGSSVAANDNFGSSVAIVGDYAIVGTSADNVGSNPAQGSAYLFRRNSTFWVQQRYITDNSPAYSLNGYAIGLSSSSFIIGGYGFQQNQGKVSFGLIEY